MSSRWVNGFEKHPFQPIWKGIYETLKNLSVDDETITSNVQEIARAVKVITYLNELIEACDPELIPLQTWISFQQQSTPCLAELKAYISNRDIGHINSANQHLDNLLTY